MIKSQLIRAIMEYEKLHQQKATSGFTFHDKVIVNKFVENYAKSNPNLFADEFIKPTEEDIFKYIVSKELMNNRTVAEISDISKMFINYYESVGWVVGKSKKPMKRWGKALNNWCKRDWNNPKTKNRVQESVKAFILLQQSKMDKPQSNKYGETK